MAGVGKFGLALLLLTLCLPAAARWSGQAGTSGPFSNLPGWFMRVCHSRRGLRGTQGHGRYRGDESLEALVGEQGQGDHAPRAAGLTALSAEAIADPAVVHLFPAGSNPGPVPDPTFLCTFLI